MRFERLDLIRYGRFTDASLVFAPAEHDLQLVLGPNEAGKSTALRAIEDLLYGIEARTRYNFLHPYPKLLIGGVLANGEQRIEVRRRKANRDSLLAADGAALPGGEAALAPFLGIVTRAMLTSMFSLGHQRLATGGREMLEAKGEAGQALFSAGTGLAGLRERLHGLDEAANDLWTVRRSASRVVYLAQDALKGAEDRQRECTVNAAKLQEAVRAREVAESDFDKLDRDRREKTDELRRLNRIRRVHAGVTRVEEIDRELANMGKPIAFPEDAGTSLATAVGDQAAAEVSLGTLGEQLHHAQELRKQLVCDDRLLARVDDVAELRRQRIEVRKEKVDLPKRREELAGKQQQLLREAAALGWNALGTDDVATRIPPRASVIAASGLAAQRGTRDSTVASAQAAVDDVTTQIRKLQNKLAALPVAQDVSALKAALDAAKPTRDVASRIAVTEADRDKAQRAVAIGLSRLRPAVATAEELEALAVPPRAAVTDLRDRLRAHSQQAQASQERGANQERGIKRLRDTLQQRTRDERIITSEDVAQARESRDAGWRFIEACYIEQQSVSSADVEAYCGGAGNLPAVFAQNMRQADALADRRFDKARAAGELAAIARQMKEAEREHCEEQELNRTLDSAGIELQQAWHALWAPCVAEPLEADAMLAWLQQRGEILDALHEQCQAESRLSVLHADEQQARAALRVELARLGLSDASTDEQPLGVLIERASGVQQEHLRRARDRQAIENQIREADLDAEQKREKLHKAEAQLAAWEKKWRAALADLQLPADTTADAALKQFAAIDELRTLAKACTSLQTERIDAMERDIKVFDQAVAEFVRAVAPDLAGSAPEDAVVELEHRVAEAQKVRTRQESADQGIAGLQESVRQARAKLAKATAAISALQRIAGSESLEQLQAALSRTQQIHALRDERAQRVGTVIRDGDGCTLNELRAECGAAILDTVAARAEELESELQDLGEKLQPATEARLQARQAVAAIGTGAEAARAAAEREEALTDLREAATRYVRTRIAAVMLQWVIDAYQREKQGPLIKRASALFAALTAKSFTGVRAEFDDHDRARLVGVCPDGSLVDVEGMSDGTADQLYLALRLAAVHEYLDQAPPMPFIADDLLINFDDERASAALTVLADLARRTQVLLFTHHPHLLALARSHLGEDIHVVALKR